MFELAPHCGGGGLWSGDSMAHDVRIDHGGAAWWRRPVHLMNLTIPLEGPPSWLKPTRSHLKLLLPPSRTKRRTKLAMCGPLRTLTVHTTEQKEHAASEWPRCQSVLRSLPLLQAALLLALSRCSIPLLRRFGADTFVHVWIPAEVSLHACPVQCFVHLFPEQ